ncbi:MAG: hypothetical protein JWR55_1682 [Aeromicrobium sp.]|nr:hypothetical protein [Aeromicrobium sp.]
MLEHLAIFAAGMWAGAINVLVGSGALVTFPTLLFLGYPPLVANVSNNIGVVAGGLTGIHGYRRELRGSGRIVRQLLPASLLGGVTGAALLFVLPEDTFETIVPVLIGLGVLMVLIGPIVQRRTRDRGPAPERTRLSPVLWAGIFGTGVYGGYFGAAQGVLLTGLMGLFLTLSLQGITGIKNVLATAVNATAALFFIIFAWEFVDWTVVGLIAAGSVIGAAISARYGRRLPTPVLRGMIVTIGLTAIVKIVFFD